MSISTTPVQQATGQVALGTSSGTVTLSTPTNGNTIILVISTADLTSPTISSVAQTNVTWTQALASPNTNTRAWIYYGLVAASPGTTITVTLGSNAVTNWSLSAAEWSGVATTSPLDVSNSNIGSSTNPATGTITPTASKNELIIAAGRKMGSNAGLTGPTNSFTFLSTANAASQHAYLVVASTTGTYSTDWTYTNTGGWDVVYATFLGSSAVVNQKAIAVTQAETVSLKRGVGKVVALTSAEAFVLKRTVSKIITAIISPQLVNLKRAAAKLISAPIGEAVTLTETASRPKSITIQSPEVMALVARFAKLQLIQVTQAQSIALVRNLNKLIQVTQAQLVRVVKSDARSINILSGEIVSVIPLRNKVVALTQGELFTLVRGISKRIQLRNLQLLHVTRNLTHSVSIIQGQTARLIRRTGKIIQLYMGQIVIAAAHGFTPDSPLQVLKNSIERVRELNNQIQRIRALKNSIKRRP